MVICLDNSAWNKIVFFSMISLWLKGIKCNAKFLLKNTAKFQQ